MPVFNAREVIDWTPGANASDTLIGGVHFNKTALDYWNYTLFSNGTLSNGSWCILTFEPYTPALVYPNGSFVNVTWCYHPVNPIGTRAGVGIGFAVAFGLTLVAVLVNLNKHGRLYLPVEKRFFPIGRRWQWYWGAFVCATAIVSLITDVDVDRYYLPELPIILNVFFWYLMQIGAMAAVWEAVRHWGSWMERQFIDPNPFILPQDDRRGKFEFWVPLFFYFWLWLHFFLIVPRDWTPIERQRSPDQILYEAIPSATDGRRKAAAFCLVICLLTILASLRHSIKHYCPRNRGLLNRGVGLIRFTPLRFVVLLPLAAGLVAYQILTTFSFENSPLNVHPNVLAMYLGGYAPSLLIVLANAAWGFALPNEDRALQAQRRARGDESNRELGIVPKPAWWRSGNGGPHERMRDRIARNVREIGGGLATAKAFAQRNEAASATPNTGADGEVVEMRALGRSDARTGMAPRMVVPVVGGTPYEGKSERRRTERISTAAAGLLFPGTSISVDRAAELMRDGPISRPPPPPYRDGDTLRPGESGAQGRPGPVERSNSTGTTNSVSGPPQQVRSMLDV